METMVVGVALCFQFQLWSAMERVRLAVLRLKLERDERDRSVARQKPGAFVMWRRLTKLTRRC